MGDFNEYSNIYKRGMSTGIDKGRQMASDSIRSDITSILDGSGNNTEKLTAIVEKLNIDREVHADVINNRTDGDTKPHQGDDGRGITVHTQSNPNTGDTSGDSTQGGSDT